MEFAYCKIEVFVPTSHLAAVQRALAEIDAGHIGNYSGCHSYFEVTGCWRPLAGSAPYSGAEGEVSTETEIKLEVICEAQKVGETMAAIRAAHPYEMPVITAIPLYKTSF